MRKENSAASPPCAHRRPRRRWRRLSRVQSGRSTGRWGCQWRGLQCCRPAGQQSRPPPQGAAAQSCSSKVTADGEISSADASAPCTAACEAHGIAGQQQAACRQGVSAERRGAPDGHRRRRQLLLLPGIHSVHVELQRLLQPHILLALHAPPAQELPAAARSLLQPRSCAGAAAIAGVCDGDEQAAALLQPPPKQPSVYPRTSLRQDTGQDRTLQVRMANADAEAAVCASSQASPLRPALSPSPRVAATDRLRPSYQRAAWRWRRRPGASLQQTGRTGWHRGCMEVGGAHTAW